MKLTQTYSNIYEVYSDESSYNNKDYAAVCMVSLNSEDARELSMKIRQILNCSEVKELKWHKIRSARDRFCANKVIDYVFDTLKTHKFRIDVVVWDVQERKLKFKDNDIVSLKKMYYQILKNVLRDRWSKELHWDLFPDEQNSINWEESKGILDNVSLKIVLRGNEIEFKKDFNINKIQEVSSSEQPLCQVADLFAGMGIFSHIYKSCLPRNIQQKSLFETENTYSNSEVERREVFSYFVKMCSSRNIRLRSILPLESWPSDPINFWKFRFNELKDCSLCNFIG